jgi:hypothetical protein
MKRFLLTCIVVLTTVTVFSNSISFALKPTPGATGGTTPPTTAKTTTTGTGETCPSGTQSGGEYIGECAECSNTKGCVSATTDPASTSCIESSCDLIKTYINPLITLLAGLVGVACVISLVIAGIQYTTSGGDPKKAAAAKSRITMTIIALFSFAFLYAFLQFIIPGGIINPGT